MDTGTALKNECILLQDEIQAKNSERSMSRLNRLRSVYRKFPSAFSPELIEELRQLANAINIYCKIKPFNNFIKIQQPKNMTNAQLGEIGTKIDQSVLEKTKELKTIGQKQMIEYTDLFLELKSIQKNLAKARNISDYLIFSDKTIKYMSDFCPLTFQHFSNIPGVGPNKAEKYGCYFIPIIINWHEFNFIHIFNIEESDWILNPVGEITKKMHNCSVCKCDYLDFQEIDLKTGCPYCNIDPILNPSCGDERTPPAESTGTRVDMDRIISLRRF